MPRQAAACQMAGSPSGQAAPHLAAWMAAAQLLLALCQRPLRTCQGCCVASDASRGLRSLRLAGQHKTGRMEAVCVKQADRGPQ
jgi:hypothetical protein